MERTQHRVELTGRQREVLRLVERGHTNSEIAERLGISLSGAKWHVRELLTKFGVESREDLIEARAAREPFAGRASRFSSALSAGALLKPVAASLAVLAAGSLAAGGMYVVLAQGDGGDTAPAAVVATATPAPTATPTPIPTPTLPAAPGRRGRRKRPCETLKQPANSHWIATRPCSERRSESRTSA